MELPDGLTARMTTEVRRLVAEIVEVLDAPSVVGPSSWHPLAEAVGLAAPSAPDEAPRTGSRVIVAPADALADLLGPAGSDVGETGVVTIGLRRRFSWSRRGARHVDPTMRIWQAGWSVVRIDRPEIELDDGVVEFAVGIARPTPAPSATT